jgi:hypothetical protein
MRPAEIRALLESEGLVLDEWEKARTDRVLIRESFLPSMDAPGVGAPVLA